MNRADFIAAVAPVAVKLRREGSALFPSVRIAQTMLETGCVLHPWNNLVGLKVGTGQPNGFWKGVSVSTQTWEVYGGERVDGVQANWRAYDTIEDCFRDQDLLFGNSRYARVLAATASTEQAAMLYACGYATDPLYASKLCSLMASYSLEQYDETGEEDEGMAMKFEHDWQWKMLGDALDGLYRNGLIADYTWAEKAYNRELTGTELAWLTAIVLSRKQGVDV
ncbi:hypothetical protein PAESOLCIP111_01979 [Paenibacillus solanacearum]|uniref:Mannosyl-glycoprotein endo-beta-N-acetylglucosamidase-like domain-containing protein n=1 Tax=Paenibacillus solanacearum TaxID=2048548 RepID=A0A916NIJ2_9BACL|nr:glucosaminidase domain-containing protein [Paenibacillus solanacearum]CAG7617085.1 hypothetical protein PAESOLCIP111_01979 [Paenibacillus solanacearum]